MTAKQLAEYSSWSREKILSEMTLPQLDRMWKGVARLQIIHGDDTGWYVLTQIRGQLVYWMNLKKNNLKPSIWMIQKMQEKA